MFARSILTTTLLAGVLSAPAPVLPVATASAEPVPPRLTGRAATRAPALEDTLLGFSGKLRARFLPAPEATALAQVLGSARAMPEAGARWRRLADFQVLPMLPFESKIRGAVGAYRMGYWPGELRPARSEAYAPPRGFIEVTLDNRGLRVSEHFRLGDFVTKDQFTVWPKYLVLREALIDKLELVIDELGEMGYPVRHMQVMSGFRHPLYNARGVGAGGRARESRHQYGDASDVFVDNDYDGRMDDLDGDGRVTAWDADLIVLAVERVEQRHPELTGGMGRYHATHAHGPFVHIDVRGTAARWGGA